MKALAILMAALLIAGCATRFQRQYQTFTDNSERALANTKACYDAVNASPAGQAVSKRLIVGREDPLAQKKMTIKAMPTPEEKLAIGEYTAAFQPCRKVALESWGQVDPAYAAYLGKWFTVVDRHFAKLLNDEIAIGDANRVAMYKLASADREWQQIRQQITSEMVRLHRYELQQLERASQALQSHSYQQQQIYNQIIALDRPVLTNCTYIGNSLSCVSWQCPERC